MKKVGIAGIAVFVFAIAGCSGGGADSSASDGVESSSQALVEAWIGPVSEESSKSSRICADTGAMATAERCVGSYCDDMYLLCGNPPPGFASTGVDRGWTSYISEEGPNNNVFCPAGSVINGIRATGSYADNVSVHCVGASFPTDYFCGWTPYWSEEQGTRSFFVVGGWSTAVATGVRCSGSYCDNMSYYVCTPKCTSDAQCGPNFCSNGVCVVG